MLHKKVHFTEEEKMRVTIDLERDIIIVPDNFLKKIADENEKLEKYGAKPVKPLDRIKNSFNIAMSDTDRRLLTQTNAKTTTRTKKAMTKEEADKIADRENVKDIGAK